MNAYELEQKEKYGHCIIYEDRDRVFDTDSVNIEPLHAQCDYMNHRLEYVCPNAPAYRVCGHSKPNRKGARHSAFSRKLCADHMAAWCTLHGIELAAKLAEGGAE